MSQIYKVFINNFFLLFTDCLKKHHSFFLNKQKTDYKIIKSYSELIYFLNFNSYMLSINLIYISKNPSDGFIKFKSNFKFIIAAGGVVQNTKKEVLMIYKNEKWDLPKGKLETHEKPNNAAIRELKEETNIKNLEIVSDYFSTYHMYSFMSKIILKETKWFLMKTDSKNKLKPQIEEGISDVAWISLKKIKNIKTYNSVHSVFNFFIKY